MRSLLILIFSAILCQTVKAEPEKYISKIKEIKVTASKYKFDPDPIVVNKGDTVRLIVTSTDVTHGFFVKEYGIDTEIKKGQSATIEFIADKTGEFVVKCSRFCGFGHSGMKGKFIVKE